MDFFWEADVNLRSNLELEKQYLMLNDWSLEDKLHLCSFVISCYNYSTATVPINVSLTPTKRTTAITTTSTKETL